MLTQGKHTVFPAITTKKRKGQGTVWAVLGPSSVFRGFYIKS